MYISIVIINYIFNLLTKMLMNRKNLSIIIGIFFMILFGFSSCGHDIEDLGDWSLIQNMDTRLLGTEWVSEDYNKGEIEHFSERFNFYNDGSLLYRHYEKNFCRYYTKGDSILCVYVPRSFKQARQKMTYRYRLEGDKLYINYFREYKNNRVDYDRHWSTLVKRSRY